MLDFSPAHLLILLIVVVVLLGPKRLPEVARQLGGAWRRLREFRDRVEQEVRSTVPDLPSSQELARYARSPVTLLDQLASMPADRDAPVFDPGAPPPGGAAANGSGRPLSGAGDDGVGDRPGERVPRRTTPHPVQPADDPSMN